NEESRLHRVLLERYLAAALRSTWTENRGLRAYEEMLPRMQAAGVNCFELWMCSWWVADEWTRRWKGYHGLGVYNLENMWRLDRILELAERYDQYIHLVIDNHGKAAQKSLIPGQQDQCDHEFENSPYNIVNREDGGFLREAVELFSNDLAKEYYRERYRYLAGRFGWCTRIYGWELWSELDLIGQPLGRHRHIYEAPAVREWHREMAAWLRRWDQGKRPITTHYSGDYSWIDRGMIAQHCIEYIVCDAYHNPNQSLLDMLAATENLALPYGKPFMITEFGGDWNASSVESLLGDLYAGLWWGWVSRSAGTPLYWWFELIAQEDLYTAYRALARYVAGEDKRRRPGQPPLHSNWPIRFESEAGPLPQLRALILGDGDVFYLWIYDQPQIHSLPRQDALRARYRGCAVAVGRPAADYHVEYWNSWQGECLAAERLAAAENGELAMPLPEFIVHLALKVKSPNLLPTARAREAE
ncbi:MAG: hypothetical protein N3A66_09165, partial [Planctomycetota bacterium]|nr:hypothetical protein [Planctomycetota bacterium]